MSATTYKSKFFTAEATIAEQADVINAQALRISELERLSQEDGKHVAALMRRRDELVNGLKVVDAEYKATIERLEVAHAKVAKDLTADLNEAKRMQQQAVRNLDTARREGEATTRFRAEVACHILGHVTLTEAIATDVMRVLNGEAN